MGLNSELKLKSNEFTNAATWFFIAFLIAEIPNGRLENASSRGIKEYNLTYRYSHHPPKSARRQVARGQCRLVGYRYSLYGGSTRLSHPSDRPDLPRYIRSCHCACPHPHQQPMVYQIRGCPEIQYLVCRSRFGSNHRRHRLVCLPASQTPDILRMEDHVHRPRLSHCHHWDRHLLLLAGYPDASPFSVRVGEGNSVEARGRQSNGDSQQKVQIISGARDPLGYPVMVNGAADNPGESKAKDKGKIMHVLTIT